MTTDVIVLNGGSSSGKSTIARALQGLLGRPWLTFGVDSLIAAIPPEGMEDGSLLRVGPSGHVEVGPGWGDLQASWYEGIAAMADSGSGVILDEVLLDGRQGQVVLREHLKGLNVLWVGVRCDPVAATAREARRQDRVPGMAARQAALVHDGVVYDVVVDSTHRSPEECAAAIAARVQTPAQGLTRPSA